MNCLALDITNKIAAQNPDCWSSLDKLKKNFGSSDNRCYISSEVCISYLINDRIENFNKNTVKNADIMAAVASWRLHKQVFKFAPEMENMLMEQADEELVMPLEVLYNLPYDCIYIQLNELYINQIHYDGFFVHFDYDFHNKMRMLKIILVQDAGTYNSYIINLRDGYTVKDGIREYVNECRQNEKELARWSKNHMYSKYIPINFNYELYINEVSKFLNSLFQLVLYLCSQNKEIIENTAQKSIHKAPTSKDFIKDKYREVQIWDCGTNTATLIRKMHTGTYTYIPRSSDNKGGTPKSPHSRRGHWHHFWTGAKNSDDRKLILKWIAPTFINKNLSTDSVQLNIVEGRI